MIDDEFNDDEATGDVGIKVWSAPKTRRKKSSSDEPLKKGPKKKSKPKVRSAAQTSTKAATAKKRARKKEAFKKNAEKKSAPTQEVVAVKKPASKTAYERRKAALRK